MLDRVLEQQPGLYARAQYLTSASLRSMSQILLVEAVAQLSGIAAVRNQEEGGFLATVDMARFGRPPRTGETLDVHARVVRSFGRLCMIEGQVLVGSEELLNVSLTLGIGPL